MKTILVPVDFSPTGNKVVAAAVRLGGLAGARIVLLHVVEPPVFGADLSGLAAADFSALATAALQASNQILQRLRRRRRDTLTALPAEIGSPVSTILRQARRLRADCIVLGSHGHGALYELTVGSVAQGVLKRATCPVLVVPAASASRR
jgi:nucleotide-binding universal stress UspA family protein